MIISTSCVVQFAPLTLFVRSAHVISTSCVVKLLFVHFVHAISVLHVITTEQREANNGEAESQPNKFQHPAPGSQVLFFKPPDFAVTLCCFPPFAPIEGKIEGDRHQEKIGECE